MLQLEATLPFGLALRECKIKTRIESLDLTVFPCEIIVGVGVAVCLEPVVLIFPYELRTKIR
jgi:hypothetical protein